MSCLFQVSWFFHHHRNHPPSERVSSMASSKGNPGPHDRKPGVERAKCINKTRQGVRCKRFATAHSKLCREHKARREAIRDGLDPSTLGRTQGQPDLDRTPDIAARAGMASKLRHQTNSINDLVLTENARIALSKLGDPAAIAAAERIDPKRVLLDQVRSAFQQAQVWEALLASVPDTDWAMLGTPAVPGSPQTAKGVRIELIQRNLNEATKAAARISKLAIDAGIEERLVRLAEDQSNMIADTVRAGVIAGIGALARQGIISASAEAAAIEAALGSAATHLRALAATAGNQTIIESVAQVVNKSDALDAKRVAKATLKNVTPVASTVAEAEGASTK